MADISTITAKGTLYNIKDSTARSEIENLKSIGRFLSIWNCTTGLPATNPTTLPYTYKTGDYYRVGTVGSTNYKPDGSSYSGTASTTVETDDVKVGWVYYYDGTTWEAQSAGGGTWGSITGTLSSQTDLQAALDAKGTYSKPSSGIPKTDMASDVQTSLGKADTALQEHQSLSAYRTSAAQDVIDATKSDIVIYSTDSTASNYATPTQVKTAVEAGKSVVVKHITDAEDDDYGLFTGFTVFKSGSFNYVMGSLLLKTNTGDMATFNLSLLGNVTTNAWSVTESAVEETSNKVTSISSASTNTQYPSAKCVYDAIDGITPYKEITVEASQILSSDPLVIQFTSAQQDILEDGDVPIIKFYGPSSVMGGASFMYFIRTLNSIGNDIYFVRASDYYDSSDELTNFGFYSIMYWKHTGKGTISHKTAKNVITDTVSVASTGSSSTTVNYITIDGTEYKIGGESVEAFTAAEVDTIFDGVA